MVTTAPTSRLAVRVTADAARRIRAGHPWVFDRSLTSEHPDAEAGQLAVLFDPKRAFAGIGLWDPRSPIRVKVLHHGTPCVIDDAFWRARLSDALARRRSLHTSGHTDMYRCVHGEGDGLPGLVLDRYGTTFVLKVYSEAWLPHLPALTPVIVDTVRPLVDPAAPSLVLRAARGVDTATEVLAGEHPAMPLRCAEHGLSFDVDVLAGHKTGHFLDQRDNRQLVRGLASGAHVLDVFCSTGGFTVNAAAGGARSVHGIDVSGPALAAAEANLALNRHLAAVRTCRHHTTQGDAFQVLADLRRRGERFDLVVLDPPSFASRQSQVAAARQAYRRLAGLALPLVRPGGRLLQASCTSRISVDELATELRAAADRGGYRLREVRRTGQPLDHPISIPEAAYLKAVLVEVDGR